MALRESKRSKLLTPLLMAGLRKERGRERGLWFPRLARTDSPTAVAEGCKECKARRETEPGVCTPRCLSFKSVPLFEHWFARYKRSS